MEKDQHLEDIKTTSEISWKAGYNTAIEEISSYLKESSCGCTCHGIREVVSVKSLNYLLSDMLNKLYTEFFSE